MSYAFRLSSIVDGTYLRMCSQTEGMKENIEETREAQRRQQRDRHCVRERKMSRIIMIFGVY